MSAQNTRIVRDATPFSRRHPTVLDLLMTSGDKGVVGAEV